jgi:hypothetical protein
MKYAGVVMGGCVPFVAYLTLATGFFVANAASLGVKIPERHTLFGIMQYGAAPDDATPLERRLNLRFEILNVSNGYLKQRYGSILNGLKSVGVNYKYIMVSLHPGRQGLREIAKGDFDHFYTVWAQAMRAYGRPVFLRWDHEMNGDWYSYCVAAARSCVDPISGGKQTPDDFVRAWKHLHRLFLRSGARNVRWVWCPSAVFANTTKHFFESIYPGSSYVDWVCLDVYNNTLLGKWRTFGGIIGRPFGAIRQIAPNKPLMIGEFNSMADPVDSERRSKWLSDAFSFFKQHQKSIRAVLLWQADRRSDGGFPKRRRVDWNVEDDSSVYEIVSRALRAKPFSLESLGRRSGDLGKR